LTGKHVVKRAFTGRVTSGNLFRHKQGFTVPVSRWLKRDLYPVASALLLSDRARARGWFAIDRVRDMLLAHRAGTIDLGHRLWSLVALEAWARVVLDPPPAESAPDVALKDLA
ncbi:MAG: hypothetical protein JRI97_09825, partial [Deltaproteobacteria bacterium]|nr:hypothetical protein [Deltaproteobacteria bacterium]